MRREVQIVFQDPVASLNPRKRVGQIIGTPMRLHGMERRQVNTRVRELLEQYPLARALRASHDRAELWYLAPRLDTSGEGHEDQDLEEFHQLACESARATLTVPAAGEIDDTVLRERLRELGVISPHAFVPSARLSHRYGR